MTFPVGGTLVSYGRFVTLRGVLALSAVSAVIGGLAGYGVAALSEKIRWPR